MEILRHRFYTLDHDAAAGSLSFLWTEATAEMGDEGFKQGLRAFTVTAAQTGSRRLLVDLRRFKMRPSDEVMAWRGAEITPLYNLHGVTRFAYILPEGASAPPAGAPDTKGDGEDFYTRHFGAEEEARSWLNR